MSGPLPDEEFQGLLAWYAANRRQMPWRGHPDPYAVWVSEIMLQQTQVATARPYFERFLQRFPDVHRLAAAPLQDVLKLWEGLGYYSRGRNLHAAAQRMMTGHHGSVPASLEQLRALPGIGPYTAAAIASICFGIRAPVVDGNVIRVFSRRLGWDDDFRRPAARMRLAAWLQPALDACPAPGDLNQAMMELGALVCTPTRPMCGRCPLAASCVAAATGRQQSFPSRRARRPQRLRHEVAVVVRRGGRLLLVRRPPQGLLGGLWELPAGEIAPGIPLGQAAAAAARAATGLSIRADDAAMATIRHTFSHFRLELRIVAATMVTGRLRGDGRWLTPDEIVRLPLSTLQRKALKAIQAEG